MLTSPDEVLLLAYVGLDAAGCVALRPMNDGDCELKRLYVNHPMLERIEQLTHFQLDDLRRLYEREWWTQERSKAQVRALVDNSDIIVAFCEAESRRLVAFARVLTDFTIKALIFDVIVDSDFRGQGLGKTLLDAVIAHPALRSVRTFELYCRPELIPFYERWGFTDSLGDLRLMRLVRTVKQVTNDAQVSARAVSNEHSPQPSLSIRRAELADLDPRSHNRDAWNKKVDEHDPWTAPVSSDAVELARRGQPRLLLTPTKPVPMVWFPPLVGTRTLCLASGGGQQGPLLAAAGAVVTVFDNSPRQLQQDRLVAQREGLELETVEGDMADLSAFADDKFDLIVHPVSNCFVPDIRAVWRECFRVLRRGGLLLAGFTNPIRYLFDDERMQSGRLEVRHKVPYSDLTHLDDATLRRLYVDPVEPLEFGHTLADQIGGQLDAGFVLTGLYEDHFDEATGDLLSQYMDSFLATRAIKLHSA